MATLVSPGVSVTVIDESFNVSSGPGTVPLIIIATGQDKLNSAGDATAPGTTASQAGQLKLISSQRELLQQYGVPKFIEVGGNALHGNPLNEYGLLTAHSYLGAANRAYTLRADINLDQLSPLDAAPAAPPADGTYWNNTAGTDYGLYEFNGTIWVKQSPAPVTSLTQVPATATYAVVAGRVVDTLGNFVTENTFYKRNGVAWDEIQETGIAGVDVQNSAVYPTLRADAITALAANDLWLNLTELKYSMSMYDAALGGFTTTNAPLFSNGNMALNFYGADLKAGSLYTEYNYDNDPTGTLLKFQNGIFRHNGKSVTTVTSTLDYPLAATINFNVASESTTTAVTATLGLSALDAATAINATLAGNGETEISATAVGTKLVFTNAVGKLITITAGALAGFADAVSSNWEPLVYEADATVPVGDIADGTLWISTDFKVDIMKNDGAGNWADITNITVQPSAPTTPVLGDIWVDSDELASYPLIREYDGTAFRVVNNTDQTTPLGILFADARPQNTGALDADAPDALAYPAGMLLWNSRYSTRNVKKWVVGYTFNGTLVGDTWVSESGNDETGVIVTGEAASKKVLVEALQAVIVSNQDIRAESVFFNLIVTPGFPEAIDEMVALNVDRKETAFVIGDTPFTLKAAGTDIQRWATNADAASGNGSVGLITADEYLGVYYPSCLSSNLDGSDVVMPASHMALRTISNSDSVAYQWFAPAGLHRGTVFNASAVGYLDSESEFVPVELSQGLSDILYTNNINPIKFIPNRGLNIWGQKTRSPVSSAMDRINVARLVNYIRYQADLLAQPFLFEPNDSITRSNVQTAFESLLGSLIVLRGLTDFLVVVDESNNTPDRIDRNELWIDIAIIPARAIEFIYIPIRVRSEAQGIN